MPMTDEFAAPPSHLADVLKAILTHGIGRPFRISELRHALPTYRGEQQALDRRVRQLRDYGYDVRYRKKDNSYLLASSSPTGNRIDTSAISARLAAQVRLIANGQCQMCGNTIKEDGIRLEVDHRVPRKWGGRTEADNLWAICSTCNNAKQAFFQTLPNSVMEKCMAPKEVWIRIGECLKAFEGKVCPRALLEVVGQDDEWTRRLRELRVLGWKIVSVRDPNAQGRYVYAYSLRHWMPWPENLVATIKSKRKARRRTR
jgi:5-methylcytosine-specific restriction endonuclease McrA